MSRRDPAAPLPQLRILPTKVLLASSERAPQAASASSGLQRRGIPRRCTVRERVCPYRSARPAATPSRLPYRPSLLLSPERLVCLTAQPRSRAILAGHAGRVRLAANSDSQFTLFDASVGLS